MGVGGRAGQGVLTEDEAPKISRARVEPPPLESWGRAELDAYIAELRSEIARVEAEIARKHGHRAAAEAMFRRSPDEQD